MNRFRELLGPDCELSEEELETLRREMHELAEVIVDAASARLGRTPSEIGVSNRSKEDIEAD